MSKPLKYIYKIEQTYKIKKYQVPMKLILTMQLNESN